MHWACWWITSLSLFWRVTVIILMNLLSVGWVDRAEAQSWGWSDLFHFIPWQRAFTFVSPFCGIVIQRNRDGSQVLSGFFWVSSALIYLDLKLSWLWSTGDLFLCFGTPQRFFPVFTMRIIGAQVDIPEQLSKHLPLFFCFSLFLMFVLMTSRINASKAMHSMDVSFQKEKLFVSVLHHWAAVIRFSTLQH